MGRYATPNHGSLQQARGICYRAHNKAQTDRAIAGLPTPVISVFLKRLTAYKKEYPNTQITLVGHSIGTFIINELIRNDPDIDYQNIIYMAGADSIRNTFKSVFPYMEIPEHKNTKFYNLTFHPQNEIEESNCFLLPRGSLLRIQGSHLVL